MYIGVPTDSPRGPRRLTARPANPKGLGQPGGGSSPPYNPQNGCTPLGVTHWLAAAPMRASLPSGWDGGAHGPLEGGVARTRAPTVHASGSSAELWAEHATEAGQRWARAPSGPVIREDIRRFKWYGHRLTDTGAPTGTHVVAARPM